MMHHWDSGWGVGNWLLMSFGMLIFWALVVALIVWVVRSSGAPRAGQAEPGVPPDKPAEPPHATARDILDQRYARGEISDEEYRSRRDTLAAR